MELKKNLPRCLSLSGEGGIDELVADVWGKQAHLSTFIDEYAEAMTIDELVKVFALFGQNASRLGRLLKEQKALSVNSADALSNALQSALDEISDLHGIKL